jgi:hypothetical protein
MKKTTVKKDLEKKARNMEKNEKKRKNMFTHFIYMTLSSGEPCLGTVQRNLKKPRKKPLDKHVCSLNKKYTEDCEKLLKDASEKKNPLLTINTCFSIASLWVPDSDFVNLAVLKKLDSRKKFQFRAPNKKMVIHCRLLTNFHKYNASDFLNILNNVVSKTYVKTEETVQLVPCIPC